MRILIIAALAACTGGSTPHIGVDASAPDVDAPDPACVPRTTCPGNIHCGLYSDGCGGEIDCGFCLFGSDECVNNLCICQPNCYMSDCGDDGCGGSCGTCDANESCSSQGRCKYDGAHTTPPVAWVCNDSFWDAGDGCDCNCGARDPDCGQAGQSLLGCTGLDRPTCDAQGLCTGGGACHAVPGSAYLTHYLVIQSPPTMFGGTVVSGRYEATDIHSYNPPGGVSGFVGGDAIAIEITGSTWKRMRRPVGGFDPVDETFTASVSGTTVTLVRTCPSALTETFTFTASSGQLVLSQASGGGRMVITFTKRW